MHRARARLFGRKESGTDLHCVRSEKHRGGDPASIGDPACRHDRNGNSARHLGGNQRESADEGFVDRAEEGAAMTTGIGSGCDYRVHARGFHCDGFVHGRSGAHGDDPALARRCEESSVGGDTHHETRHRRCGFEHRGELFGVVRYSDLVWRLGAEFGVERSELFMSSELRSVGWPD